MAKWSLQKQSKILRCDGGEPLKGLAKGAAMIRYVCVSLRSLGLQVGQWIGGLNMKEGGPIRKTLAGMTQARADRDWSGQWLKREQQKEDKWGF